MLALSSTAVGIKILEDVGELRNETGRVAVGVLIAQDLAVVPMLIMSAAWRDAQGVDLPALLLKIGVAVVALVALIWALSRRQRIHLPFRGLWVRHPDLAPVGALALCMIGAAASGALELSAGLGAFLAGLYVGNTTERALMGRAIDADPEPAADDVLRLGRPLDRLRLRLAQPRHRAAADRPSCSC